MNDGRNNPGAPPPPYSPPQPQGTQPGYPVAPYAPPPPPSPYGQPQGPYGAPAGYGQPPQQQQPYGYPIQPVNVVVQNQMQPYPVYQPYPYAPTNNLKKDTAILLAVLGLFFGICGLQRFYLKETGMGVLYLLTGGACFIGQIIDIVSLATMAQQEFDRRYNYVLPR